MMLYIYIELRYQRQLGRICPDVLEAFFSSVSVSVRKNGGTVHAVSGGTLYCFDHAAVGYAFSASRAIADLRGFFEMNRLRMREYFALVGDTDTDLSPDAVREFIEEFDAIITPDSGILLTSAAATRLAPYVAMIPLNDRLSLYSGSSIIAYAPPVEASISLSIYTAFIRDPVSAFRNMLIASAIAPVPERLSAEEQPLFAESVHALEVYSADRFSSDQPEFRLAACLDYFELAFRSLRDCKNAPVTVAVHGSKPLPSAFDAFLEKLSPVCAFSRLPDPVYLPSDFKTMPDDLLDLSWLVARAVQYLNADEIFSFFLFLGKESDFVEALGIWMYSYGLLADPRDFRTIHPLLVSRVEPRLGERKPELDRQVACFLWKKYEEGFLVPSHAFCDILDSLGFSLPDSFLVSCLFYGDEGSSRFSSVRSRFRNSDIAVAVERTERAWKAYNSGDLSEAGTVAREALRVFQEEHVLAGEYRVLSLISLLSLAKKHGDDSVVYLEYALENAGRMHDRYATLCTLFDTALVHFILGNFHYSVCTLESVDQIVESCYAKNWEVLVLFMKGRIALELGDYRNAELYFQTAASLASFHHIPESVSLCRVWYARSIILQGRYATGEEILLACAPLIPDAYVFMLEAFILSGRKDETADFPKSIANFFAPADRWSSGKFTWKSGFAMAEDRCQGTKADSRVVSRMYDVFYLCCRSRFCESIDLSDSIASISSHAKIACEQKDPYGGIYYYFAYELTMKLNEIPSADATALLSRAFKYMQKRANEIGDNNMREQYMQTPVWNSRLYRAARDNMLI